MTEQCQDSTISFGDWPFLSLTAAVVVASTVTFTSIAHHFMTFTRPAQQLSIIAILAMIPVYQFLSWGAFSLVTGRRADILITIRDAYDAVIVYAFYSLLRAYISSARCSTPALLRVANRFTLVLDPQSSVFLAATKALVLQFVVLKLAITGVTVYGQAQLDNCSDLINVKYFNAWFAVSQYVSLPLAIIGLAVLHHPVQSQIAHFKAIQKFVVVKGVILLGFIQDMIMLVLYQRGLISLKSNGGIWTLTRLEAYAMTMEVLVLSIMMLYYFSYFEYETPVTEDEIKRDLDDSSWSSILA
ncbi:hypothetical protein HDU84_004822 [Entophlyctis sp. JEL0112]|nr:hypothetical protein HDU84_004822 [Entophlyctis sp. JEL0112]